MCGHNQDLHTVVQLQSLAECNVTAALRQSPNRRLAQGLEPPSSPEQRHSVARSELLLYACAGVARFLQVLEDAAGMAGLFVQVELLQAHQVRRVLQDQGPEPGPAPSEGEVRLGTTEEVPRSVTTLHLRTPDEGVAVGGPRPLTRSRCICASGARVIAGHRRRLKIAGTSCRLCLSTPTLGSLRSGCGGGVATARATGEALREDVESQGPDASTTRGRG
mmetsp:Transcript_47955/g.128524  ORF Transcript_47955/g.128524 Transcript_47955/m.128524 type:complete len:220 (+) Transcript_47955:651-1310(+)